MGPGHPGEGLVSAAQDALALWAPDWVPPCPSCLGPDLRCAKCHFQLAGTLLRTLSALPRRAQTDPWDPEPSPEELADLLLAEKAADRADRLVSLANELLRAQDDPHEAEGRERLRQRIEELL